MRHVDAWHRSVTHTIDRLNRDWFFLFLTYVDKQSGTYGKMLFFLWRNFTKGDFASYGRQIYEEHIEEVQSLVPKERLLIYKVSEGWKPLCEFLDLPIPDVPFPSGNDQDSFWKSTRALHRSRLIAVAKKVSPGFSLLFALLLAWGLSLYFGRNALTSK